MGKKMDYKLLALDVDGTLLNHRHVIARETKNALAEAMRRGVQVTLATGRGFPSAAGIARQAGIHGPLVTHDGAYVADPETGEVLSVRRMEMEVVKEAVTLLRQCRLNVNLLHERVRVSNQMFPEWRLSLLLPKQWTLFGALFRETLDYRHSRVPDLLAWLRENPEPPEKMFVTGTPSRLAEGRAILAERLGDKLRTAQAGSTGMEVMQKHVSKATGIQVLADHLGISMDEVIAVGDNFNDLEMLRQAGLGVAMGNAPDEVKRVADWVTAPNDQHGVARVVQRFVV